MQVRPCAPLRYGYRRVGYDIPTRPSPDALSVAVVAAPPSAIVAATRMVARNRLGFRFVVMVRSFGRSGRDIPR